MTACEWLIQALQKQGVEWLATLCGHGLDPLYYAAHRAGLRLIDTRNEQTAAYMAEAYAKLTRHPGVVLDTFRIGGLLGAILPDRPFRS